ncbi:MAG TPA: undecaprenyl-diphosphate phosphatase [Solirubrobacteraceae bacterium]
MRLPRALALGLLHGPAELLPVSSSAHAALLLQDLDPERRKEVEVALHAGTLLALGPPRLAPWLLLSTAPPALAGLFLEERIERRLGTPRTVAAGLVAGGVAMALADRRAGPSPSRPSAPRDEAPTPTPADAFALGVAQAAALVPGVSRHGAALTALRLRGFTRARAHAASREASKPVLAGAAALKGFRVVRGRRLDPPLLAAAAASAVSTRLAMGALAGRGVSAPLLPFALYRAALAAAVLATQPSRT